MRGGLFDKARDVYEEGLIWCSCFRCCNDTYSLGVMWIAMSTVTTAQDFTLIFDAYSQYEESMLEAQMAALNEVRLSGGLSCTLS